MQQLVGRRFTAAAYFYRCYPGKVVYMRKRFREYGFGVARGAPIATIRYHCACVVTATGCMPQMPSDDIDEGLQILLSYWLYEDYWLMAGYPSLALFSTE